MVLPMSSLPVSGCWSIPIVLSLDPTSPDSFEYAAVVDTGSPFLTAPTPLALPWTVVAVAKTNNKSDGTTTKKKTTTIIADIDTDTSNEQYGTTVGSVEWRTAPLVTLVGMGTTTNDSVSIIIRDQPNVVVGLPSLQVQNETGGIFLGLMRQDEYRPTFLQQFGYTSFRMDFSKTQPQLMLTQQQRGGRSVFHDSIPIMSLYDLTPYGPDLHHYGVVCRKITCQFDDRMPRDDSDSDINNNDNRRRRSGQLKTVSFDATSLSRPLLAVFDTGLSGCIFSDTLLEELKHNLQMMKQRTDGADVLQPCGCQVELELDDDNDMTKTKTVRLSSTPEYWRFQSFSLPWWYDELEQTSSADAATRNSGSYPHVVVLGSTFWRDDNIQSLCVDTVQQKAQISVKKG